jgi:RimJ/RimL family protein N-acetyltransferase
VADAEELAPVLEDDRLHEFIGGRPLTLPELRDRYGRLVAGSPDAGEVWLNWVVRSRFDETAVGTVQATVAMSSVPPTAHVAWVIGVAWQGRGLASEAARGLVDWLRANGVGDVYANVHPDHHASAAVATRAGLHPTDAVEDGERVWRSAAEGDDQRTPPARH